MTTTRESIQWGGPGNGVAKAFDVGERVQDASHLLVYLVNIDTGAQTLQALGTNYTLDGVNDDDGCTVNFVTAPSSTYEVVILLNAPFTQTADLRSIGGRYNAIIHEDALDRLQQQVRRLWHGLQRAVRFPATGDAVDEAGAISGFLNKYVFINSSGEVVGLDGEPSQPVTHTSEVVYPTDGQTLILVSDYTPGLGNLSVYKNGLRLIAGVDYVETSSTSVTLAEAAEDGDVIEFAIGEVFTVGLAVTAKTSRDYTAAEGQTAVTIASYTPGFDEIEVFLNGALQSTVLDYEETNATTITFVDELADGDQVRVIYGQSYNPAAPAQAAATAEALYPRTLAEIIASVFPVNYQYPQGNALRYGNYSTTDNTTVLQAALNVARYSKGVVHIPHAGVAAECVWISDGLTVYSGTTVECAPGVVVQRKVGAAAGSFLFNCTTYALGTPTLLTANVKRSRKAIGVTSAAGLTVGQTVVIRENTYVDSGTSAGRWQEINEIEGISGLNVTLKNGLMLDYATANSAALVPFTTDNRDVVFRNVTGRIPTGTAGGIYKLNHAYRYRFENSGGSGMDDVPGLLCYYGTSCRVEGGTWKDSQNATLAGHGHAISWHEGSVDCHAFRVSSFNIREHLFAYGAAFCSFSHCYDVGAATATWNSHGEGCHDCAIEYNTSIGAKQYGISIGGATSFPDYRITVRGNKVYGAGTHGIVAQGLTGGVFVPYDCVIEDNIVEEYGLDGTASRQGISLEYCNRFRVRNNRLKTAQSNCRAGIYSYGCDETVIEDNYVNGVPSGWAIIYDAATDLKIRNNTGINLASGNGLVKWDGASSPGKVLIEGNQADNDTAYGSLSTAAVQRNNQWKTKAGHARGATSVADGGTISHGLVTTPTSVRVTGSVSGEFVSVTAVGSTTFTVAIKTHSNGAGTTQTVYWEADV